MKYFRYDNAPEFWLSIDNVVFRDNSDLLRNQQNGWSSFVYL